MAVNTDEALLTCSPLTSCCVAQLLTGHRLLPVCACGLGTQALHHLPGQGGSVPQAGLKTIPVMYYSPKNAFWEEM